MVYSKSVLRSRGSMPQQLKPVAQWRGFCSNAACHHSTPQRAHFLFFWQQDFYSVPLKRCTTHLPLSLMFFVTTCQVTRKHQSSGNCAGDNAGHRIPTIGVWIHTPAHLPQTNPCHSCFCFLALPKPVGGSRLPRRLSVLEVSNTLESVTFAFGSATETLKMASRDRVHSHRQTRSAMITKTAWTIWLAVTSSVFIVVA